MKAIVLITLEVQVGIMYRLGALGEQTPRTKDKPGLGRTVNNGQVFARGPAFQGAQYPFIREDTVDDTWDAFII